MREVIVGFDETLSLKASNVNVLKLEQWAQKEFVAKSDNAGLLHDVHQLKKDVESQVTSLSASFKELNKNLERRVLDMV
jgi:hypothetical protein